MGCGIQQASKQVTISVCIVIAEAPFNRKNALFTSKLDLNVRKKKKN
jgi:hypothetical protein